MPIYEYRARTPGCEVCRAGFEAMQKMSDPRISDCPECGAPVERVMSAAAFSTRATGDVLSRGNIEKNGFTRYERAGGGQYVKTAGKGPDTITR